MCIVGVFLCHWAGILSKDDGCQSRTLNEKLSKKIWCQLNTGDGLLYCTPTSFSLTWMWYAGQTGSSRNVYANSRSLVTYASLECAVQLSCHFSAFNIFKNMKFNLSNLFLSVVQQLSLSGIILICLILISWD